MNEIGRLNETTKASIVEVLDRARDTINQLAEARDASLRLMRHANARAADAEDRLERVTAMLAMALGYQSHSGQTAEGLAIEVERIVRGLRGDL